MKLKLNLIPTEIVQKNNLQQLKDNGWIYIRIDLGMYGLPQAGILANKLLDKQLGEAGSYQCQFTPGLRPVVTRLETPHILSCSCS